MCTVTFIPAKDGYHFTSNRDEKFSREQALPPDSYLFKGARLIFPKDAKAGGSWVAMKENGTVAVLLNGAFKKHISNPPYKKSRGIVFLEVVAADEPVHYFTTTDLGGIEPFTLLLIFKNNLYECRWDGEKKHFLQLDNQQAHIWSSATLYTEEVVNKREQWFKLFLKDNPSPTQDDILHFHVFTGDGDSNNDLKMDRDGLMLTISVTSIFIENGNGHMIYEDLIDNKKYQQDIHFTSSAIEA